MIHYLFVWDEYSCLGVAVRGGHESMAEWKADIEEYQVC